MPPKPRRWVRRAAAAAAGCALVAHPTLDRPTAAGPRAPRFEPHVVVATLDTGTNPFHPAWRRPSSVHPSRLIPGYPRDARAVGLAFDGSFEQNVVRSDHLLAATDERGTYWVPGTNFVGLWAADGDGIPIFDPAAATDPDAPHTHDHGARASSQIAGEGFGLEPEAYLVVMDRTHNSGGGSPPEDAATVNARALRWAADQPWIDVIHTNIQNPVPLAREQVPVFPGYASAVRYALDRGKVVVAAGGNFYAEPTETSPHTGPPGALVVGANDNCGFADYSNPDPHVVMDGYGTVAAAPAGEGEAAFSGTSSASPRVTGYVAELLLEVRRHFGYTGGIQDGALVTLELADRPGRGPLADGRLTAAELHEVVRRTASPSSHPSKWDGTAGIDGIVGVGCIPDPGGPFAFYPKMGYGEVSEHTIGDALAVATGAAEMPERPVEDRFYEVSEELRRRFWD
jgi:hypothetical protein